MLAVYVLVAFFGLAAAGDYDPVYMDQETRLLISKTKVKRLFLSHETLYPPSQQDKLLIQSAPQTMIVVAPRRLNIDGTPPDCTDGSSLKIIDVNTKETIDTWCGKTLPEKFAKSTESYLRLEFNSGPNEVKQGFDLIISEINTGTCSDKEYMCATDFYCIDKRFKCDGFVNCPDGSDEDSKYGCYVSTAAPTTANVTNATTPIIATTPKSTNVTSGVPTAHSSRIPSSRIPRTSPGKAVTTFLPISTTQSAPQNGLNVLLFGLLLFGSFILGKY